MSNKKLYVIGTSVDQSLSPLIFNHWFKKYNIKASYDYKVIKEKNFAKEINKILKEKDLCGINITIPFKEKIIKKMHKLDRASKIIGAVNCVSIKNNKYHGSNSDWTGFAKTLSETNIKKSLKRQKQKKIIVIGYGGAAKAILYGLMTKEKQHTTNTIVFNRTKKRINIPNFFQKTTKPLKKISESLDSAKLIINTTPKNIFTNLKIKKITNKLVVCDIVYKPKETDFLKHFKNPTAKIYGIDMLINQAKPCFFKWFGFYPTNDKKLEQKIKRKISQ